MLRHILVVLFLCCAVHAETFSATGDSAAELQDDIDAFTSQLGVKNAFTPTTNAGGFRSINWDAAPDSVSDPAAHLHDTDALQFPSRFFNFNMEPRARGIEFYVPDDSDILFISSKAASGTPVLFGDNDFRAFTEERIFGVRHDGDGDVYGEFWSYFFMPDVQREHGWSRGLAAVFIGVEDDDSSLTFYDQANQVIETVQVERNADGFSFAGYLSDDADVFSVKFVTGNSGDFVAIDDVFFGEPQRRSSAAVWNHAGPDRATIESTVETFRTLIGPLNAFDPVCLDTGRRQINWDAAPENVSDPDEFPGDFFNFNANPRARGIEFSSGNDNFLLSATSTEDAAGRGDVLFGRPDTFQTFSPERLFAADGDDEVNVHFFEPCNQDNSAKSSALGVVFTNVKGSQSTVLEIFTDDDNDADWVLPVLPRQNNAGAGLSFCGIVFNNNVADIKSARIGLPTSSIGTSSRAVVMDDFIFGEPRGFTSASASAPGSTFSLSLSDSSSGTRLLATSFALVMLCAFALFV